MKTRAGILILFLISIFSFCGCATIVEGPRQKIIAHCTPTQGVSVAIDGKATPYESGLLVLERKRDTHFVTFTKDGFYDNTLSFNREFNTFWAVADIIWGPAYPLAIFVDWYVGSIFRVRPDNINVVLRKKE